MVKFDSLKEGDVLWQITKGKMGNTTIKTLMIYTVRIISIDRENRCAMVSWNGNPPRLWSERNLKKLRRNKPETYRTITGSVHLKPRSKKET